MKLLKQKVSAERTSILLVLSQTNPEYWIQHGGFIEFYTRRLWVLPKPISSGMDHINGSWLCWTDLSDLDARGHAAQKNPWTVYGEILKALDGL
jgi:hypothetical protein